VRRSDLLAILLFFVLPALLFWPTIFGGKTLIPADNLFTFPPFKAFAAQLGVGAPHNQLVSDLLLENYVWKRFIVESLHAGQIPLWNPYLFAGVPFLAAGQHSALYPLTILFYFLPIPQAYGLFTALQLALASLSMYFFARVIHIRRWGAFVAALTYTFSGFFLVSTVFPMFIAVASWLPLVLAFVELIVREEHRETREIRGNQGKAQGPLISPDFPRFPQKPSRVLYACLGALVIGLQFLAGHIDASYYVLLVTAFYTLWRVALLVRQPRLALKIVVWLGFMVGSGVALAGVQLVPLYELARLNFRQESATYEQVVGWAFPLKQLITFVIPDFFGNPSHHAYLDVVSRQTVSVGREIFWGTKNYVEAGSYVGILPLLLAVVATVSSLKSSPQPSAVVGRETWDVRPYVLFFALLALLSMLFAFGTPLYAILFNFLPGYRQLHSPFRWVFPYTLAVSVLAGIGADWLSRRGSEGSQAHPQRPTRPLERFLAWLAFGLGLAIVILLVASLFIPAPFIAIADRVLSASELAQTVFADGRAFYSYEFRNFLVFGLFLMAGGAVLRLSRCPIYLPKRLGGQPVWKPLAVALIVLDLFTIGAGFNAAADPKLLEFKPPAVEFLQQDASLFRITSYDGPGDKTFNPNVGMFYGLSDVRGYDSIIPKQYADYMNLIEGQGELLYNRIAPIYWHGNLDSRLLDLLGVKYVLTTRPIPNPNYTLVYDREIKIYRNEDALPRAFIVPRAKVVTDPAQWAYELKSLDPIQVVLLEEEDNKPERTPRPPRPPTYSDVRILRYTPNEVVVQADLDGDGWLVLADSYFPGWQAFVSTADRPEKETPIYKADGNFRAVELGSGRHVVRFKYNPFSFKLGLYATFLAAMVLALGLGAWAWGRLYREQEGDQVARRVAKNSLIPMGMSLLNKAIDTAFAAIMLRVLGPTDAGKFAFAVVVIGYFDIFVNFGLNTLVTREVARDRSQANRYLSNTALLRLILIGAATPILALVLFAWRNLFALSDDTTWAILLLALGLVPSGISAALSSIFMAHEKMEYPAAITTVTTLVKVTLGLIVLLAGWGFVGLAASNIVVNVTTLGILFYLVVQKFFVPRLEFQPSFGRAMLGTSYPLMLNDMLSRLFFRVDVTLLQPLQGDLTVGWYTTAYKYLDGLNILPSTFTLAIFPLMSRYAATAKESLLRAYLLALKFLIIVSVPLAMLSMFYAEGIILIFGGPQYLPEAAIALQLIIWFLPFSFINSVTHYVLIALNQQRFLTLAFVVGFAFNLIANLIFIPMFSYRASAVITIFSEIVLLAPFYYGIRQHLASVPWLSLFWKPMLAGAVMGAALGGLGSVSWLVLIPLSLVVYFAALVALRALDADEWAVLRMLVPSRRQAVPLKVEEGHR